MHKLKAHGRTVSLQFRAFHSSIFLFRSFGYLTMPLVTKMYSVGDMIINEYGEVGGMRIGRKYQSTRRIPAPVPLCPPQIPHGSLLLSHNQTSTDQTCIHYRISSSRQSLLWLSEL
jgi:hypothetical protein